MQTKCSCAGESLSDLDESSGVDTAVAEFILERIDEYQFRAFITRILKNCLTNRKIGVAPDALNVNLLVIIPAITQMMDMMAI